MFTISAMPVKFVCLLLLFAWSTIWEARQVGVARGASRISHGLHLLMAVVMLAMVPRSVWKPLVDIIPTGVFTALMALGALWFAWRAVAARAGHRAHAISCALMFLAMTWHLGAMQVKMHSMGSMKSGSMDHGSMAGHAAASGHSTMWWFALVGLPLMVWLLYAGITALVRAIRVPGNRPADLADFAMNFGMFWMSTGLLVPIIPAFSHLAF